MRLADDTAAIDVHGHGKLRFGQRRCADCEDLAGMVNFLAFHAERPEVRRHRRQSLLVRRAGVVDELLDRGSREAAPCREARLPSLGHLLRRPGFSQFMLDPIVLIETRRALMDLSSTQESLFKVDVRHEVFHEGNELGRPSNAVLLSVILALTLPALQICQLQHVGQRLRSLNPSCLLDLRLCTSSPVVHMRRDGHSAGSDGTRRGLLLRLLGCRLCAGSRVVQNRHDGRRASGRGACLGLLLWLLGCRVRDQLLQLRDGLGRILCGQQRELGGMVFGDERIDGLLVAAPDIGANAIL